MRLISLLTWILPDEFQEEWLGDLRERRYTLIIKGSPQWLVSLKTVMWSFDLIWSFWCVTSKNLVSPIRNKLDR
ncbi:MAG TPA: hypothetical protein DCE56_28830 [Cyanobacteria bacterium UBA8553]|nr:hypothetical protein [Cyanobacteria bacterium UBA8553]HAJ60671.1 hypothetical protein [Cyanobacteria bacterium UBA8543]